MEAQVAITYPEHDVHLLARHFTSENLLLMPFLRFLQCRCWVASFCNVLQTQRCVDESIFRKALLLLQRTTPLEWKWKVPDTHVRVIHV